MTYLNQSHRLKAKFFSPQNGLTDVQYGFGVCYCLLSVPKCPFLGRAFLFFKRRTVGTVYVEYNFFDGFAFMNIIAPLTRLVYQGFEVLGLCKNLGFKPSHLADLSIR